MIPENLTDAIVSLVVGLAGGGALGRWLLERRQARVAGAVAEATAPLQVAALDLANLRAQIELMSAAWAAERTSLSGRITSLSQMLADERAEATRKDAEIRELKASVNRLESDVARLTALVENR